MKNKLTSMLACLLLLTTGVCAQGQNRVVTGRVISTSDGTLSAKHIEKNTDVESTTKEKTL